MMMRDIFTFYEHLGHQSELDLLNFWRLSWEREGWRTHVLTLKDTLNHPKRERFLAHTRSLPTVNHRAFEDACYVRWLAFSQHAGAMADYDVIPVRRFPPRHFRGLTNGQAGNMGFMVGRPEEIERFVDAVLDYRIHPGDRTFDRPHVSDMVIVQRSNHIFDSVEPLSKTYLDQHWERYPLVHFTNGSRKNRSISRVQEIQAVIQSIMKSETSTARERLAPYCVGNGLDIGAGGDSITPNAICIDRADDAPGRAHVGNTPTHLVGDAANLHWFRDNSLDYVYSSHTLEDFEDTTGVLREWLRVIKPGGHLVLFLPDQPTYAAHCAAAGAEGNLAHKHKDFSPAFVQACLARLGYHEEDIVHMQFPVPNNPYSFDLVVRKK